MLTICYNLDMSILSENLRKLRKERRMTQREFASIFNISNATIANWELGKREPDHDTTIKIANYFNVTLDELLGTQELKPEKAHMPYGEFNSLLKEAGVTEEQIAGMSKNELNLIVELTVALTRDDSKKNN